MASRPAPYVIEAVRKHTATVIFAHGLGDQVVDKVSPYTGQKNHHWGDTVKDSWLGKDGLGEIKFMFPNADSIPVTFNGGMVMPAWYNIITPLGALKRAAPAGAQGRDALGLGRLEEDAASIAASRAYLDGLIQAEVDAGIPPERILLGGFSQGGAMALLTTLGSRHRLAGVAVLSSYLLLSLRSGTFAPAATVGGGPDLNRQTPIRFFHGTRDQIVPTAYGLESKTILETAGYNVDWKTYLGMEHSVNQAELDDLEKFLEEVLPPLATATGKDEL